MTRGWHDDLDDPILKFANMFNGQVPQDIAKLFDYALNLTASYAYVIEIIDVFAMFNKFSGKHD